MIDVLSIRPANAASSLREKSPITATITNSLNHLLRPASALLLS